VLRDTAVTGAPGAARPPLMGHQPCQPSAKSGSQAAVWMLPLLSVTKMSYSQLPPGMTGHLTFCGMARPAQPE
jgi:hypothetical protein